MHFLEFEKPIAEIEGKIAELRHLSEVAGTSITDEILKLQSKASKDLKTPPQGGSVHVPRGGAKKITRNSRAS